MYRIFTKLIKKLEKDKPFVNKEIIDFLKACEKQELAKLENVQSDYFLHYFNQLYLSMDYNQRIIDSGWDQDISKDPERENIQGIDYTVEEILTYAPFFHYETGLLFLAKMYCRKCKKEFFAILPFIFYQEAFDFGNGFQWTIKEFPLTAKGYLEASQLYFKLISDITLQKIQTRGKHYLEAYVSEAKELQIKSGKYERDEWKSLLTEDRIKKQTETFWWTRLAVDLPYVNFYEKYQYLKIGTRSIQPNDKQTHLPYHEREGFEGTEISEKPEIFEISDKKELLKEGFTDFVCNSGKHENKVMVNVESKTIPNESFRPECPVCKTPMYLLLRGKIKVKGK